MKSTVISPANIAFIKYWGQKDKELFLPYNNSISMNLSNCTAKTTVEFQDNLEEDIIEIKFFEQDYKKLENEKGEKQELIFNQIERVRKLANINKKVYIKTENTFPADAGIASSASGFSALTTALLKAAGLNEIVKNKKELSKYIRLCGSGSAVRSVHDGFVEFIAGDDHDSSYAEQIADEDHFDIVDLIAIVSKNEKKVSSTAGHLLAETSPYFDTRIKEMQFRINDCRKAILEKDFSLLGKCIEEDSISMHSVMMTSVPPIFYWNKGSMEIMNKVLEWRNEGLESYATLDAGSNVHVICQKKDSKVLKKKLEEISEVIFVIENEPCKGVIFSDKHLF